jgi:hypothetical protein
MGLKLIEMNDDGPLHAIDGEFRALMLFHDVKNITVHLLEIQVQ